MGNYNSQYESYYSTLVSRNKNHKSYNHSGNNKPMFKFDANFFVKRIIIDLVGVSVLFVCAFGCKIIITPQTKAAYSLSKSIVNKNYDYKALLTTIKDVDSKSIQNKLTSWMENIKGKITGSDLLKEKIKNNFSLPVEGKITLQYGKKVDPITNEATYHEGVDIDAPIGEDIINPYDGRVKDCGENDILGKYILVDHKDGIETKYGHLSDILVKKDVNLSKGQVIGKTGNTGKSDAPHLHFELIFMGENKNPADYMKFNLE